jgi:hypothetical protein
MLMGGLAFKIYSVVKQLVLAKTFFNWGRTTAKVGPSDEL